MNTSNLSARGSQASDGSAGENLVWHVCQNLWNPITNPSGYVSLGVAENTLMSSELREFLNKQILIEKTSFTYGDGPAGHNRLRSALATFFNTKFGAVKKIGEEDIVVTNGASSIIEHVSWTLANPGDGILLGRPYYRAFLGDVSMRTGVKVVPVSFGNVDPCGPDCVSAYEATLEESEKNGVKIRALLLCHPHNPLGRWYSKDTVIALMKLCQKYNIHLISDEIYAMSVWDNIVDDSATSSGPFKSVLSINKSGFIDPSLVHVIWGLSKDFGANGIRIGALISQSNSGLLDAVRTCAIYSSPSSIAENAATSILSDSKFLEYYITENCKRLSQAHAYAAKKLKEHDIEYRPGANAAFFLWINLGKVYLEKHPKEARKDRAVVTKTIFGKLMERKVYLVSGDAAGAEVPGWFRFVFTHPSDLVDEGLRRITDAMSST